ncbi:hypothetical protein GCM10027403_14940 [Arthrobacter tecti]
MTKTVWNNAAGIASREQYAAAVSGDHRLTLLAREVGVALAHTLRRDGIAETSIGKVARKLQADASSVGRAIGQLRRAGYIGERREDDGITCTLPTSRNANVIDAFFAQSA